VEWRKTRPGKRQRSIKDTMLSVVIPLLLILAVIFGLLPVVLAFLELLTKQFIRGLTAGALKG
jgi:hypothetical protein